MEYCDYQSQHLGRLVLVGDGQSLIQLWFPEDRRDRRIPADWRRQPLQFEACCEQLAAYFEGRRKTFELNLAPTGTPFQQRVWAALCEIPYGETVTYGEVARAIGNPKAVRAVGGAIGRNPIPIIIPCHRVVGKDGTLTGFGGGLRAKATLLRLEGHDGFSE